MAAQSYQGALLFINFDADNLDPLAHRHNILSHVQKRYQPWKRRERSEALFASIKSTRSRIRFATRQDEKAQSRTPFRTSSPITLIAKGNSDPFAVYPIDIGPEENDLIILYRDHMIPSLYSTELGQKHLKDIASQDWKDAVGALEDTGTAFGALARYGSIAGKCNPRLKHLAYKYHVKSLENLRTKISRGHDLQNSTDCMHVSMLFAVGTALGNLSEAITHGRILLQILQKQWQERRYDYKLLIYQVVIDFHLSSMFVKRMIFDDGEWLEEISRQVSDAAAPYAPVYPRKDWDPCIPDEWLRASFEAEQQRFYFIASPPEITDATSHLGLVFLSHMIQAVLFHSRMIDHYLKIADQLRNSRLSDAEAEQLVTQQYLALAAAQLRRHVGMTPKIFGVYIYDSSRLLMALKNALQAGDVVSRRISSTKYRNAKLWALCIGALAETAAGSTNKNPSGHWFNKSLANTAVAMEICSWDKLQPILEGFLYYDGPFYIKRPACFEDGHLRSRSPVELAAK
ncbi:uncharacterized protein Z520_08198 [Fonsecaea multimorphosa CBS 102226]|uniref:Uncharacterized protein n=1 Tax=Fonsecaea multimorphosa CBS 102226 TaxID=1442371 RepID=A0A0D2KH31_9EURO|nr:uncharacterized protein Z520_08198 [Fonsecaea multimorphosa CBS 102226]KIX95943.1 hypothetical protein Z520_08198 [Fonsecaea multimorphosa CBS 102226]OAL21714.1 hypothetical protein AYO22_07656 [Fonsecaea multimorphosa]